MANIKQAFEYASQNPNSDFAKKLTSLASSGALNVEAEKYGIDLTPFKNIQPEVTEEKPQGETGVKGLATGFGKGILERVKGIGQIGEKIGNLFIPKKYEIPSVYSEEVLTKDAELGNFMGKLLNDKNLEGKTPSEKIGKGIEKIAEFAIPQSKLAKSSEFIGLTKKLLTRAITSGTVASVQSGDVGKETAIASGLELALPGISAVAKPALKFVGGLFRGIGGGLSGVSDDTLKLITENSGIAKEAKSIIKKGGADSILKQNVDDYIKGISKFRSEMSGKFEKALNSLQKTDINPEILKKEGLSALEESGAIIKNGKIDLSNTEILNPTLQKRATNIINQVNSIKFTDGKTIRSAIKKLEASQFKNAGIDPDRQAYNDLMDKLADSFTNAINKSTNKLKNANLEYSASKGLIDATQKILGSVKFKNESEILDISKKFDNVLKGSGLSDDVLNRFYNSIGVNIKDIQTKQAVKEISTKELEKNSVGTNPFEIIRMFTSKIVTPKMVRDIAIMSGESEKVISKILKETDPEVRATLISSILELSKSNE